MTVLATRTVSVGLMGLASAFARAEISTSGLGTISMTTTTTTMLTRAGMD
jgi:hypothetical protein